MWISEIHAVRSLLRVIESLLPQLMDPKLYHEKTHDYLLANVEVRVVYPRKIGSSRFSPIPDQQVLIVAVLRPVGSGVELWGSLQGRRQTQAGCLDQGEHDGETPPSSIHPT